MAYKWKQGAEALKTFSHDSHKKLTLQCTQVLFSVSINSLENSGFFHLVPLKTEIIIRFIFYGLHSLKKRVENKSFIH